MERKNTGSIPADSQIFFLVGLSILWTIISLMTKKYVLAKYNVYSKNIARVDTYTYIH